MLGNPPGILTEEAVWWGQLEYLAVGPALALKQPIMRSMVSMRHLLLGSPADDSKAWWPPLAVALLQSPSLEQVSFRSMARDQLTGGAGLELLLQLARERPRLQIELP
jgi:hypothetical protein